MTSAPSRAGGHSMTTPSQISPALAARMPNAGKTLIGSLNSAFITLTPMYRDPKRKNKFVSGPPSVRTGGDEPQDPDDRTDNAKDDRQGRDVVHRALS